ncbi:MAG: Phenylalanine--tRNA ligase [Candidatus Taylorbacteria bacterium]|nr:Phenylalanine--tRNA ligase [Candidatus Taylorbacteria bacterium]
MKISHKWLQTYFKKPLPSSDKIAELLTFHIFEVEGIEKKTTDDILDVKVLPDRASYCLSHQGVAQELAALIPDNEFIPRTLPPIESDDVVGVNVSVEAGDFCDSYNAIRIMNVTKADSPTWLKEKLEAVGQRSINVFADIANFVMLDIGQPMHVFDARKVSGDITVRYARVGEMITTLDSKEVKLDSDVVIISDEKNPLAIAGIKGGKLAETTHNSDHVIVESAHFDASLVRKTSSRLNIKTDSSKRFENGVSGTLAIEALNYFVSLLKKEDSEITVSGISSAGLTKKTEKKVEVSAEFINEKLGKEIPAETIIELLKRASINARREGAVIAVYPTDSRKDLNIKEDIVDEVGRLYGYENIEGTLPSVNIPVALNTDIAYRNIVRNFLVGKGFSEVQSYTLAPKGEVEIINPLAEDKKYLRTDLATQIEEKLKNNIYYSDLLGQNKIKVFEFGRVWKGGREFLALCIGIAYKKAKKGERPNDEIKIVRDELFEHIGSKIAILCTVDDSGGIISKNGKSIGMTNNIDGIMEVDFESLIQGLPEPKGSVKIPVSKEVRKYKAPSPYPFMVRDIAVFVPGDKSNAGKVWHVIETHIGDLLVRHELFDVFEKTSKETGAIEKTSFAFRLVFQSYEKTLTDDEINKVMERITGVLIENKWEVR